MTSNNYILFFKVHTAPPERRRGCADRLSSTKGMPRDPRHVILKPSLPMARTGLSAWKWKSRGARLGSGVAFLAARSSHCLPSSLLCLTVRTVAVLQSNLGLQLVLRLAITPCEFPRPISVKHEAAVVHCEAPSTGRFLPDPGFEIGHFSI